jgi:putative endonuclease
MPWTYIVQCADGSYYVGSTVDLEGRLWQHNHGELGAAYTRRRRPVTLAWSGWYERIEDAFRFEKQVQGWSRRKREALIRGDWEVLPNLAKRPSVQRRLEATDCPPTADH